METIVGNMETIKRLYQAFGEKDYDTCRHLLHPKVEWIQNPGFPGGGHHHGADAVVNNVFKSFKNEWEGFGYRIDDYLDAGNTIVVLGEYYGKHLVTGKSMTAMAAHVYDLEGGLIIRFRQYTDTHMIVTAME